MNNFCWWVKQVLFNFQIQSKVRNLLVYLSVIFVSVNKWLGVNKFFFLQVVLLDNLDANKKGIYIATTEDRINKRIKDMDTISKYVESYQTVDQFVQNSIVAVHIDDNW